jgi:hypothetical protein
MRKAELAGDKKDDDLARAALERAVSFQLLADNFDQQIANHHTQVESMKSALKRLELKLEEARAKADLLIVQHRRSRATQRGAVDLDEAPLDLTARFLELVDTLGERDLPAPVGPVRGMGAFELEATCSIRRSGD